MEPLKAIFSFICENKMYFLGGFVGLITSILMLTIGFFPTLLLLVLTIGCAAFFGNAGLRKYTWALIVQAFRFIRQRFF